MTDRPLTCRDWEVRAFLGGRKTESRVVLMPQPREGVEIYPVSNDCWRWDDYAQEAQGEFPSSWQTLPCAVGDRYWVRETWAVPPQLNHLKAREILPSLKGRGGVCATPVYAEGYPSWQPWPGTKWRPSTQMPRWAARIWLEVTSVRVERLQDIRNLGAVAEGCPGCSRFPHEEFRDHWNDRYAKRGLGWDANPWVVVRELRRIEG